MVTGKQTDNVITQNLLWSWGGT